MVPDVFHFCTVCTSGSRANFGNHDGNQSCSAVSPLESWSPAKVVPGPKMGTTVGTTCAPQMQKWFPFRVSRTRTGPRMTSFLQRSVLKIAGRPGGAVVRQSPKKAVFHAENDDFLSQSL